MQGVLVQSVTMRANVAAGAYATAEASHVFAAKATEMASAAEASDVTSTAKSAATTAKTSAVTTAATATATAGVGRARQQARSEKRCCQYRDHPFHRDTPFQSDCSAL
jgi:hypothetical protein